MNDLFAFGSAGVMDADDRYGTTGDMKKTQYVMQLLGFPGNADTLKCLLTAGEKGIEIESAVLDMSMHQQDTDDYRHISPFGIVPALREAKYTVAGDAGVMCFIEGRGLGNRLSPRNAGVLAEQMYWIDIACNNVAPQLETLMQERVLGPMSAADYLANNGAVATALAELAAPLDAVDGQLADRDFIVGDYSYADIHWTAYIHLLKLAGEHAQVEERPNLRSWFSRIKKHKSFSGQDLVAFELLPTLDEIKSKKLKDVVCGEF